MNVSNHIVSFLAGKGVTHVFGYPGSAVLPLYDALSRDPRLTHILARHEQGAAHMACGYARMSGRPGVCLATSGPGAANLICGITDANLDSVPMLILTGQVDTGSIGRDAFQEADIMGMTLPVTKHNYLVRDAEQLPDLLEEAWAIASSGRRGPVLIDLSHDVLTAELADPTAHPSRLPRVRPNPYPPELVLPRIREELESHYRPLILAGGGVVASGASEELSLFAEKTGIPVVTTMMGMGIRMNGSRRPLGMTGQNGTPAARTALDQCDLLIAAGVRFSDRTVSNFTRLETSRMVIHCDIDPAEISKNVRAELAAVCEAKEFFERLNACDLHLNRERIAAWSASLDAARKKHDLTLPENRLSSREIMRHIDELVSDAGDTVYVSDVGNVLTTAAIELEPRLPRGFIASCGLGVMGFALPASIGASFALPAEARRIVTLAGDGGLQMTLQELALLKTAPCPVKLFVFDNHALGMIQKLQRRCYNGNLFASELADNPDFVMLAQAYGLPAVRLSVSDRPRLHDILHDILCSDETLLVHCLT